MISLETPQRKWASSCLEGRTSWIFSSCGRCSRLTMGTSATRSGGLRKGQSPCELLGDLSGFHSRRCRGLYPCVESLPEPEDFSPVLTWIWGTSGVSPGESVLVSRGGMHVCFPPTLAAVSHLPSRESRDQGLSLEAFPRGFPSRLSHRAVPRASVV